MRTSRKILLALVLTLCVAAVLSVCAFAAYDKTLAIPQGVAYGEEGWVDSDYADIDRADSGYVMIGINNKDNKVSGGNIPAIAYLEHARFYWNKTTDKAVWVIASDLTGNSGEENVINPLDMSAHSAGRQKLYLAATIFVDLAEKNQGVFSEYVSGYAKDMKTDYPVWYRYTTTMDAVETKQPLASTGTWATYTATAAQYEMYAKKKAELVAARYKDTDLEDALVAFVNENITGVTVAANCTYEGAFYTVGYIFNQLEKAGYAFDTVEFRRAASATITTYATVGLVTKLIEAKTILMDSRIKQIAVTNTYRSLFGYNAALKTFAHVEYEDMSGNYTNTVKEGYIDLTGFVTTKTYSSGMYYCSEMLIQSGVENVIWFSSLKEGEAEYAGVIDDNALYRCRKMKTLTLNAPLTAIDKYGLRECTSLTVIDLKGGISADVVINADAFYGTTQAITVYVYTSADEARANAAFASYSNITVVKNGSVSESAITADGYSIRINDTNAQNKGAAPRAEFTLLQSAIDEAYTAEGLTIGDYGLVIFSANTLNNVYGGDVNAIVAAIQGRTFDANKIKVVSAANGPYVKVDVTTGDKTFAAAVTGISDLNYDSELYTYAYATWTDAEGKESYTFTTYTSTRTGKTAHSLYDATVFAFATGVVNSQNFVMSNGVELWDILQKGAFSVTEAQIGGFGASISPNVKYKFTDEDKDAATAATFTYLDLPLYAWKYYVSKAGKEPEWNSCAYDLEETSSTNVLWSILRDGKELIVVYRAASDDADATLPALRDRSYGGYAPYSSKYFTPTTQGSGVVEAELKYGDSSTNGFYKYATIHSPILTSANAGKITTIVLDYGIDKISGGAFENTTQSSIKTIVYPEGVTATTKILNYCHHAENVIYASANKDYYAKVDQAIAEATAAGKTFGAVADLSGLSGLNFNYAFSYAQKVQNIILPSYVANSNNEEGFREAYSIKRVWSVNSAVPADGTVDLTAVSGLIGLSKNCFTLMSKNATVTAPTIILPAAYYGVSTYCYKLSEGDPCSRIFGENMSFTIVLNDIKALTETAKYKDEYYSLMAFYDMLKEGKGNATAARADNLDKLTFVCDVEENGETVTKSMSIADWRTYLVANGLYTPA